MRLHNRTYVGYMDTYEVSMSLPQTLTTSALRADLYKLLDRVLETGEPLEIVRKGQLLRISLDSATAWVDRLPRREGVVSGDPDALVSLDWSQDW